jgi:anthranilate synthase component 1
MDSPPKRLPALVQVSVERIVDTLTPLALYDRVRPTRDVTFLLESLEGGEHWARFSFIGVGSVVQLTGFVDRLEVSTAQGSETLVTSDPVATMAEVLEAMAIGPPAARDTRFNGGAVGTIRYDACVTFEPTVGLRPSRDTPLLRFVVPEVLIAFDLLRQRVTLTASADVEPSSTPEAAQDVARRRLEEVEDLLTAHGSLRSPVPLESLLPSGRLQPLELAATAETTMTQAAYEAGVERCKEYIRAGDVIQVVLSQRLRLPFDAARTATDDPVLDLYRRLRLINPSPYLFLLDLGDEQLVGASPEVLARKTGRRIEVRPIAGTRRRGASPEQDRALAQELQADPKERAEHIMLLDLGRNDIGRVAEVGSVDVVDQLAVERYSHVMHLVSHVVGQLRSGLTWRDTLAATFPAGTLSGAPKVRAMQIIDELEPTSRGPYGGAVGYVGFDGNMDFCIAIRTLHVHDGVVDVQAGAGIVADSDPRKEWEETLNKAAALLASLPLQAEATGS